MSNTETWDEERLRASIANREEVIADLRAEAKRLADTLGSISRHVDAESCDRDVLLDAIGDAYDAARRGGEASMREAAASWCELAGHADLAADIRAFALTGSQPSQSPAASETPEAPQTVADAAARARDAARGRVAVTP